MFIICNWFSMKKCKNLYQMKYNQAIHLIPQLGDTLNPLDDYAGVPSINDE